VGTNYIVVYIVVYDDSLTACQAEKRRLFLK
jgi:hypothetical protein